MRYVPPSRLTAFSRYSKKGQSLIHFTNFRTLPSGLKVEEQTHDFISKGRCLTIQIENVLEDQYQIVGNFGYGLGTTFWPLARADTRSRKLQQNRHTCGLIFPSLLQSSLRPNPIHYLPPSRLMYSFWYWVQDLVYGPDSWLVQFNNSDFQNVPSDQRVEEETLDASPESRYFPVRIGDVYENKYQILGKLGYGLGSTVWLANEYQ